MFAQATSVETSSVSVLLNVAQDQGVGTGTGTLVLSLHAIGNPREFTHAFHQQRLPRLQIQFLWTFLKPLSIL